MKHLAGTLLAGVIAFPAAAQVRIRPGVELYAGGVRSSGRWETLRDGYWAGSDRFYPSTVRLDGMGKGLNARLSVPVGDLRGGGAGETYDGAVEAWAQRGSVTAGKFWVPFGAQSWVYQSRWGARLDSGSLSAAVVYTAAERTGNVYVRGQRTLGRGGTVGLSVAGGRGIAEGMPHHRGVALDLAGEVGRADVTGEATLLSGPGRRFTFGSVALESRGRARGFVEGYAWNDRGGDGRFRSAVGGLRVAWTRNLEGEAALAATKSDRSRNVGWIQLRLHWPADD